MNKKEIQEWIKNDFPENYKKMILVGLQLMRKDNKKTHLFSIPTPNHESKCYRCQRTYSHWYEFPFTCQDNINSDKPTISEILNKEEELYEITRLTFEPKIIKTVEKFGISAKAFAYLKQTHGIPLDYTCDFLLLKVSDFEEEFNKLEQKDKSLSRASQVKEIITVNYEN